jgi:hypothetical protein
VSLDTPGILRLSNGEIGDHRIEPYFILQMFFWAQSDRADAALPCGRIRARRLIYWRKNGERGLTLSGH